MADTPGSQHAHLSKKPMTSPTPPGLVTSGRHIPPGFPEPRVIEWTSLQNLQLLRHGTGTSVYSATLEGEPVVVKTPAVGLKPEAIFDVTTELQHESGVLAGLSHPNIVRFHGHGSIQWGPNTVVYFIVMERLLGGSLNDRVASNRERSPRIRAEQCLPMLAGLTQALGYLHIEASATHYIVHRDIKPDNVGFTADGTCKLFDFGLCGILPRAPPPSPLLPPPPDPLLGNGTVATPHPPESSLASTAEGGGVAMDSSAASRAGGTGSGAAAGGGATTPMMNANSGPNSGPGTPHHHLLGYGGGAEGGGGSLDGGKNNRVKLRGQTGSIRYMAPEVALGTPYDETVDVYSLSLVAWEAIHLRKPFHGVNVDSHRRVVCLGLGREEIDKAVPLGLAQLIRAGWDNEPDRRPTLPQAAEALQVLMLEAVASQHEGLRPLPGGASGSGAGVPHGQPGANNGGFAGYTPHPFVHANHHMDQATAANAAAAALIQQQQQQMQAQKFQQQPPPPPHPPQRSGSSSLFGLFGHIQTPKTGPSDNSHHGQPQRPGRAARNP